MIRIINSQLPGASWIVGISLKRQIMQLVFAVFSCLFSSKSRLFQLKAG